MTTHTRFVIGIACAVVLGLVAGRVAAREQAPTPAAPSTSAISGVVIDGATGKPIGGATVTFWSMSTRQTFTAC